MSEMHRDLADLIVDLANREDMDLTEAFFTGCTMRCTISEKHLVFGALPTWAQARINNTALTERRAA